MRDRAIQRVLSTWAFVATSSAGVASAGVIADENAKPGTSQNWVIMNDGTANAAGVVDVYPASWSIARGEPITLKVRSTASYSVHLFRLGWYGSLGSREVATVTGRPADPQPYPSADPVYGRADANWHDTDVFPTDATWTPGVYVARIDRDDGLQAATYVVIRDDGSAVRAPILLVVGTATDQAYNGWPGMNRGGKSLYGFNSSAVQPEKSVQSNQAVIVSNDRPYLVGFGLGDVINYEYPFIRWLEGHGYDVAYATDPDLQFHPEIAQGRKVISESGHSEYWSRPMRDTVTAARDAGTNLLFLTGDTISWQVRFEDGGRTMIGYKESWVNDPEQDAGEAAWKAGDQAGAQAHFAIVTRGWASVGDYPKFGLTAREPGMTLVGLHSGGAFGPNGPWGDLIIENPSHWLFAGTGFKSGDRIKAVMGYEFDTAELNDPAWDPFRPPGQQILGTIVRESDGERRGNSATYVAKSGAEVVAFGAVQFSWALDDYAASFSHSKDDRVSKMMINTLTRWNAGTAMDPVVNGGANGGGGEGSGGCSIGGKLRGGGALLMMFGFLAGLRRRLRRRSSLEHT